MNPYELNSTNPQRPVPGRALSGSRPKLALRPGNDLATSQQLRDVRHKQLVLGRFAHPGEIHVYGANCGAGERLRLEMLVPSLPMGSAVAPAFAVIAQSLPYSADVHKLPFPLPAGFSAVVAPPPRELAMPVRDMVTRALYYLGPTIDTRTLVSGPCYVVVWSPQNQMGKYMLQVGHRLPLSWLYWLHLPHFWWQVRGWYGLSRSAAYVAMASAALLTLFIGAGVRRRTGHRS